MKKQLRDLEAMNNWIDARVDALLDDKEFQQGTAHEYYRSGADCGLDKFQNQVAFQQACSEHAEIEAMILNAQIDNLELK